MLCSGPMVNMVVLFKVMIWYFKSYFCARISRIPFLQPALPPHLVPFEPSVLICFSQGISPGVLVHALKIFLMQLLATQHHLHMIIFTILLARWISYFLVRLFHCYKGCLSHCSHLASCACLNLSSSGGWWHPWWLWSGYPCCLLLSFLTWHYSLLKIDIKNAFNECDHAPSLDCVSEDFPEIDLGSTSLRFGHRRFLASKSVQQGDPLFVFLRNLVQ